MPAPDAWALAPVAPDGQRGHRTGYADLILWVLETNDRGTPVLRPRRMGGRRRGQDRRSRGFHITSTRSTTAGHSGRRDEPSKHSGTPLNDVERDLLAGILSHGPEVVHLQSGHGLDDLALIQADAKSVVGVDYSAVAVSAAQRRANKLGLTCRYVVGTVPGVPLADQTADLAYPGKGALIWMADINAWAREAARLLRPGGHLLVCEGHPRSPCGPGTRTPRVSGATAATSPAATSRCPRRRL
jgi:SAM-dependent methyltransferase